MRINEELPDFGPGWGQIQYPVHNVCVCGCKCDSLRSSINLSSSIPQHQRWPVWMTSVTCIFRPAASLAPTVRNLDENITDFSDTVDVVAMMSFVRANSFVTKHQCVFVTMSCPNIFSTK